MKLDLTKPIRWKDTKEPAHYIGRDRYNFCVIHSLGCPYLQFSDDGMDRYFENVPERVVVWENIYPPSSATYYHSRLNADRGASANRVAVHKVVFEGDRILPDQCEVIPV